MWGKGLGSDDYTAFTLYRHLFIDLDYLTVFLSVQNIKNTNNNILLQNKDEQKE